MTDFTHDMSKWNERDWKFYNAGMADGATRMARNENPQSIINNTRQWLAELEQRAIIQTALAEPVEIRQENLRIRAGLLDRIERFQKVAKMPHLNVVRDYRSRGQLCRTCDPSRPTA